MTTVPPAEAGQYRMISFLRIGHAALLSLYSVKARTFVPVPNARQGLYRLEDENGVEYIALANGPETKRGVPFLSDYKVASAYPPTVFMSGHGESAQDTLTHEELEAFRSTYRRFLPKPRRVWLPNSYTPEGEPKFRAALMWGPDDIYSLDHLGKHLRDAMPTSVTFHQFSSNDLMVEGMWPKEATT